MLYDETMARRATSTGAKTREAILQTAADVASIEGLDGLSIGRLATQLGMSKSGLFAHFGSMQDLQLATIETARQRYVQEVVAPGLACGSGLKGLYGLCESFLSYLERGVFPGGCFFASAMAEFDCKAPGPVRDRVAKCQELWMDALGGPRARRPGRTRAPRRCIRQFAFELKEPCCPPTGTSISTRMRRTYSGPAAPSSSAHPRRHPHRAAGATGRPGDRRYRGRLTK